MNLHQFRFVQEAVRQKLNLTETAKALHTSQPGISKAILELEGELGVDIFARHGKRLRRVTEPGEEVLKAIEIIMREVNNLKRIGHEFSQQDAGTLSIATTHNQARYVLPGPIAQLRKRYPKVNVSLHQGTPEQVAKMLLEDVAEVGLATESLSNFEDLITLPCYEWHHVVVVPTAHPFAQIERLTLAELAQEPLISYHPSFAGRSRIDQTFAAHKLKTNVVLEAIDADVIKTYVRLGLGVGIVSEMAMKDDPPGGDLIARPAGHLFGPNVARLAFKRGAYLRSFVYAFAQLVAPRLSRQLIEQTLAGQNGGEDESL
jgi:LysR family cys regulon transcriptional activator